MRQEIGAYNSRIIFMTETIKELESITIRFAGDSGDGIQVAGSQFTNTSAIFGNDISTFPNFPAEIRAPAGSLAGVSGFQINFSSRDIHTPGDRPQVLIAMNPAALKSNIGDLEVGGIVIVNTDNFKAQNLKKAEYENNPLEDGSLQKYQVFEVPITTLNREALKDIEGLTTKNIDRCQNFFALGLTFWIYDRPIEHTSTWIENKFANKPEVIAANKKALQMGYYFGENTEAFQIRYRVKPSEQKPGIYRKITGNEALAMGLVTAAQVANKPLFYGSYPITPASDILHYLAAMRHFDVRTFQAEDEIAAIGSAIGAAFGGAFAVTGTSGPGVCLKGEAMGLALALEIPLIIVDVQRGGPSTGLPTKTEQSDLLMAMYGRNGESPLPIIAPCTPSDCFDTAIEAFRWAVYSNGPVIILSDGYLANSSEPWKIPDPESIPKIEVVHPEPQENFLPYERDPVTFARPWAIPGTAKLEHRLGGLAKQPGTGNVSYDPNDHQQMVNDRAEKVQRLQQIIPDIKVHGPASGKLLVIGWGGTYGAIHSAVTQAQEQGKDVSSIHLRHLNPFPKNLGDVIANFEQILVPELNMGQLLILLRLHFRANFISYPKVQGQPFKIEEIFDRIVETI